MQADYTPPDRLVSDPWPRPGARFAALVIEADRLLYRGYCKPDKKFPVNYKGRG